MKKMRYFFLSEIILSVLSAIARDLSAIPQIKFWFRENIEMYQKQENGTTQISLLPKTSAQKEKHAGMGSLLLCGSFTKDLTHEKFITRTRSTRREFFWCSFSNEFWIFMQILCRHLIYFELLRRSLLVNLKLQRSKAAFRILVSHLVFIWKPPILACG